MATATAKTTTTTEMPELAQKIREQLLVTVQQGQQLAVDAAENVVKTLSALPAADLPTLPSIPNLPSADVATKFAFAVAGDLLGAQREFVLQLGRVLAPAVSA